MIPCRDVGAYRLSLCGQGRGINPLDLPFIAAEGWASRFPRYGEKHDFGDNLTRTLLRIFSKR